MIGRIRPRLSTELSIVKEVLLLSCVANVERGVVVMFVLLEGCHGSQVARVLPLVFFTIVVGDVGARGVVEKRVARRIFLCSFQQLLQHCFSSAITRVQGIVLDQVGMASNNKHLWRSTEWWVQCCV